MYILIFTNNMDKSNILIIDNNKFYWDSINNCLIPYELVENNFNNNNNTNLKPTIIRKNELTSIEDFINTETNDEIKPKKIEIYFIDGMVGLNYKINKYEKY